jgi:hypothetical protein
MTIKIHFSLPNKVLVWVESEAKKRGMRRSQFLTYLLTRIIDEQRTGRDPF